MAYIAAAEKKLSLGGKKKRKGDEIDFYNFDAMRVSLASPEQIVSWSFGEVKKPETINYRTLKPERDGLFCERIFGPVRDFECACGKFRWIKFKGIVCDRCGVEVTESKVRRERMGHIELAVPVAHIWFLKKTPSRMGIVLDMKTSDLERIVYYAMYVVLEDLVDPSGRIVFRAKDLVSEEEVRKARGEFKSKLKVDIGAGAVQDLLSKVRPKEEAAVLLENIHGVSSEAERTRLIRRLRILQGFVESGNKPEWMVSTNLPVIPPELRPLVPLEGGRFATSDLNDLYRRIINRNNRLKHIEALRAPEVMIFNEKRLLQEAVDALFENGARGRVVIGAGNRPLKSLSDILKGKQGRFRQNLLGKRVDYSGRSVIVVGPNLKLNQCGLPKDMAMELFKPFILRELMKMESLTLKAAKRMFDKASPQIWDILETVTKRHPVMLNRAPTLHRLGIQAFEPVLIEGKSIQLHPLTCAAFNADFDGDQMAVHVPLSQEAQLEARMLMMASNNILSPASGKPIATPSHDMVLGLHYLTKYKAGEKGEGCVFSSRDEVLVAYLHRCVDLHAKIRVWGLVDAEGKDEPEKGEGHGWSAEYLPKDARPETLKRLREEEEALLERKEVAEGLKQLAREDRELQKKLQGCEEKAEDRVDEALAREISALKQARAELETRRRSLLAGCWPARTWTTVGRVLFDAVVPQDRYKKHEDKAREKRAGSESSAIGELEEGQRLIPYSDRPMGKKELSKLVERCYRVLGNYRTTLLLDRLKHMGYHFATVAGLSISVKDMHIPAIKKELIVAARKKVREIQQQGKMGVITDSERYNKIIDIWTHVTDKVADVMFQEMKREEGETYAAGRARFNSIFLMADSGARGSRQQVRQLAGMRGLMARPQKRLTGGVGEIIEQPIESNFREGLTVLEYFISTHGGRKGLADTALKTADAGYLTRRLVDVSHDVVVTEQDCGTINGVRLGDLSSGDEIIESLEERILGRVLIEDVVASVIGPRGKPVEEVIAKAGEMISPELADRIRDERLRKSGVDVVRVRSVLTCEAAQGVCAMCYGMNNANGRMVEIGEAVGIIAAQSIGEPGTQLTLRTFHIGGTASRVTKEAQVRAAKDGVVEFHGIETVLNRDGANVCVSRVGKMLVRDKEKGLEEYKIEYGSRIKVKDGAHVAAKDLLAEWDPYTKPIIADQDGKARLVDVKEGVTLHEERNKITGIIERTVMEQEARRADRGESVSRRLKPMIVIEKGEGHKEYHLPAETILLVEDDQEIQKGDILAKIPQQVTKSKDITGGLPRVAELFEARIPRNAAVISEIDGVVSLGVDPKGQTQVSVRNEETNIVREYTIPHGKHLVVYQADRVGVGEAITDGAIDPHDVLRVKGVHEVQEFLVNAIQEVYRLQGVTIADRHIECIVRQMLQNVKITNSGDTAFLRGEIVSRSRFTKENEDMKKQGNKEAQAEPVLLGITKASLASSSFISAASFQETTRVLTEAAATSKIDYLKGLKENVIIGHMIPAGTGLQPRERLQELAQLLQGDA